MVDFHCCMCEVCGGNVMPARMVREWVRRFCDKKRMNIHIETVEPGSKTWMEVCMRVPSISSCTGMINVLM